MVNRLLGWRARDEQRPIIIVSGLPRSGTSLMMQMLQAGGVPVLVDQHRPPDASNPKGYYEFEPVKRLAKESAWMKDAAGHALKVVSPLLMHLPAGYNYRVIFMLRDLDEVLRSQRAMLQRQQAQSTGDPAKIIADYESHLGAVRVWLNRQPNIKTHFVEYADLIRDPASVASQINGFLGGTLHVDEMPQVVDPSLYRERKTPQS